MMYVGDEQQQVPQMPDINSAKQLRWHERSRPLRSN